MNPDRPLGWQIARERLTLGWDTEGILGKNLQQEQKQVLQS